MSSDRFNRSRLRTVVVATMTSNTTLADMPGNVLVTPAESGLSRLSVINVTQLATVDRAVLDSTVGSLPLDVVARLDEGLRLVLRL